MVSYDEPNLVRQLEQLPVNLRVAFAAACAERLLPAYSDFAERTGRGNHDELAVLLKELWLDLQSDIALTDEDIGMRLETCMSLIPREDDGPWVNEQAYAENAASALAYAFRARKSGESQDAAWAARSTYEAADYYVTHVVGIDTNSPGGEKQVLSHPIVQAELQRQRRDLDELASGAKTSEAGSGIVALQARARLEASLFFSVINDQMSRQ